MVEFSLQKLLDQLHAISVDPQNQRHPLRLSNKSLLEIFPNSIQFLNSSVFFIGWNEKGKALWIAGDEDEINRLGKFDACVARQSAKAVLLRCPLNHHNATIIRNLFAWAGPSLIGTGNSFGFGDRIGIANPAHARAAADSPMKAVFAQQSIRELQRTDRRPEEVIDAATWAVLQEGYTRGFGADADHLKTKEDIDRMMLAGFTMFTIDPGDEVIDEADDLLFAEVAKRNTIKVPQDLGMDMQQALRQYVDQHIEIAAGFVLRPGHDEVQRCLLKYSGVVTKTVDLYHHLKKTYPAQPAEIELSIDETDSVTTAFEHYFIANELKKRQVILMSLAPRFIGRFEKGVDYIGDIAEFMHEYKKHQLIAQKMGGYKIGFHSGSDKFQVYQAAAKLRIGSVHVKTAGTSYLEALRTLAATEPALFRRILDFCRGLYEIEKRTYHVSANLQNVPAAQNCSDQQLPALLDDDDARQVLHVTYGRVLTEKNKSGQRLFYDEIHACLEKNETRHDAFLVKHFHRHLQPFDAEL